MTSTMLSPRNTGSPVLISIVILLLVCGASAQQPQDGPEPAVFLNFDEGSGTFAMDSSGQGNAGTLYNVTRLDSGGCGRALLFANPDSYVAIPYRALNHPKDAITVSAWFYIDNYTSAPLVSTLHDGGYRLGFGDGNDLWWTVDLANTGEVSLPIQHENIAPGRWHHVTGTYDGSVMKVYLDGSLRNQANATGRIRYGSENYVILGAEAGAADTPAGCPRYYTGGLDEVRIYPVGLSYTQVMDDRFRCLEIVASPAGTVLPEPQTATCEPVSGSIRLAANETARRTLTFADMGTSGTWDIATQPGSRLSVRAFDHSANAYPDEWYLEIADEHGSLARTIAFPSRYNTPAEAVLPTGNATVTIRYFDGMGRFPSSVDLELACKPPVPQRPVEKKNILENPIIVIYSASWATLVAILLVIIWLNRRRKAKRPGTKAGEPPAGGEEKL